MRRCPLIFIHDAEADAVYVALSDGNVSRTEEVLDGILIDLDASGRPIGVEVTAVGARVGGGDLASYLRGLIEGLRLSRPDEAA